MLGQKKDDKQEIIRIDQETFFIDRQNGTLTRTDDVTKTIDIKSLTIDQEEKNVVVLWDRLTGMPYKGFRPEHGSPLKTVPILLPKNIRDKNPPPKTKRFRR